MADQQRDPLRAVDPLGRLRDRAGLGSLSISWKKSEPISASGTCPQIASTGACDFLAS
jgi:hypothetical protein